MENKYYTPSIEEFCVGFEYERMNGDKWCKDIINPNDLCSGRDGFENEFEEIYRKLRDVRVKYLDKEDIESLGFEFGEYSKGRFKNETIELFNKFSTVWVIHAIGSDYRDKLFEGNIKNLSELKVLLKQLNIL